MKLSIVATLYRSSQYLDEFCTRCIESAEKLVGRDFEIVLVNDGSPDKSLEKAVELHESDARIKVIDLSKNFGHHKAMMAGLSYASGEQVFLIDSDLEEQPEWLLDFSVQLESVQGVDQIDVVYGVQKTRKGGWFERVSGELFFKFFDYLSDADIPRNLVTARLMRRRYVDGLLKHSEREYFIAGLWAITGFNQKSREVKKLATSPSSYSLLRRLQLTAQAILCFSTMPLRLICALGLFIASLAALFAILIIIRRLSGNIVEGWASIIVAICFFGGLNFFGIGVIGLYLGKVFSEVKQRPTAIIREIYDRRKTQIQSKVVE
jgi:putative glycosyltransferase